MGMKGGRELQGVLGDRKWPVWLTELVQGSLEIKLLST